MICTQCLELNKTPILLKTLMQQNKKGNRRQLLRWYHTNGHKLWEYAA